MRIITGKARGTQLFSLEGENTRPTSDRAKEGIFNILQNEIRDRKILDLFGGSGQLALECLSRGAQSAVICDNNRDACGIIRKNASKTNLSDGLTVLECDWKTAIKRNAGEKFDIVFLDPPYSGDTLKMVLFRVFEADIVSDGGFVVCETDRDEPLSNPSATLFRFAKYGRAKITVLQKKSCAEESEGSA